MKKQYKAVIFDLDGVICHTDKYHYLAWKQLADKLGIYFDETINNRLRGVSRMESLEIILEKYDKELSPQEKADLAEEKNNVYRELLQKMSPADLAPETKETLNTLRAKGLKLAIGSSSRNAVLILNRIGLGDFFEHIADGNAISKSKPDPEVFLLAAKMLGNAPTDCLVVEDAKAGVEAGLAGNFDVAAIGDAATMDTATYKLDIFKDLLDILV